MPTQTGSIDFKSTKGFQSYASGQYATLTQVKGQFATCSTAAGTQAKAATIVPSDTGWELYTGATITVKFTADNTHATPTLNVNSTGAKSIRDHTGAALTEEAYKWKAGDALAFTYDGTYWRMQDTLAQRVTTNKTAIEQNARDIILRATKEEASQMAQPNLSPWFSLTPIEGDGVHWHITYASKTTFTPLEDGWVHLHNDNSAGTSVQRSDYEIMGSPSIKPGENYTWLFEYRNNNSTGNNQNYIVQTSSRTQFWGNTVVKVLEGKSGGATTTLGPSQDFPPGTEGIYVKRVVKTAEAVDSTYLNRTGTLYLGCLVCYANAGAIADYDIRVSIYEGEYTGPYKPYVGSQLYASQAELKVTADGITSTVSKIASAKYVDSKTASWPLASLKTYAAEGHSENWNVTSTDGLRVGDTVYVKGTDSTRNCTVYIKTTVTAINSTTNFTGTSHGYEDVLPVDTIKSTINQSSDSVKIQARHVEIDGEAIFSSIKDDVANQTALEHSGSGTSIAMDDAATASLKALTIYGKSVQDGTPTPSAPIEIRSVGLGENLLTDASVVDTTYYAKDSEGYYNINNNNWAWAYARSCVRVELPVGVYVVSMFLKEEETNANSHFMAYASNGSQLISHNLMNAGTIVHQRFAITGDTVVGFEFKLYSTSNRAAFRVTRVGSAALVSQEDAIDIRTHGRNLLTSTEDMSGNVRNTSAGSTHSYSGDTVTWTTTSTGWPYFLLTSEAIPLCVLSESDTMTLSVDLRCTSGGGKTYLQIATVGSYAKPTPRIRMTNDTCTVSGAQIVYPTSSWARYTFTVKTDLSTWGRQGSDSDNGIGLAAYLYYNDTGTIEVRHPQLELGSESTEYEPYRGTVTTVPLNGHELRSLPDGTRDELTVDMDGHVTMTQRVGSIDFDGSSDETWTVENGGTRTTSIAITNLKMQASNYDKANIYSNRFVGITPTESWVGTLVGASGNISNRRIHFSDGTKAMDATAWRTWLTTNPTTVLFPYETPQTINLGTIDMPQVKNGDTIEVIAATTPSIDATWWGTSGQAVADNVTIIDGGRIRTGSVTANQIAAGTITGNEIAGGTITSDNIETGTISADRLDANALTVGNIAGLEDKLETITNGLSSLSNNTQWVHFDAAVGTVFGDADSVNNVTVRNDGVYFNTEGGEAAKASAGIFYSNEMQANDSISTPILKMGNWALMQSGTTFSIEYLG